MDMDIENLRNPSIRGRYHGEVKKRSLWQAGTEACTWESQPADSNFLCEEILEAVTGLYEEIVIRFYLCDRISLTANKVVSEKDVTSGSEF